jgi:hypothetical protein
MSAANLSAAPHAPQQRALSAQGYRQHLRATSSAGPRSASHPHPTSHSYETKQPAKSPIAQHEEIASAPGASTSQQNGQDCGKELGYASEQLQVEDFDLVKTLGTGTSHTRPQTILLSNTAALQEPSHASGYVASTIPAQNTRTKCSPSKSSAKST